jgi:hypothetical protein
MISVEAKAILFGRKLYPRVSNDDRKTYCYIRSTVSFGSKLYAPMEPMLIQT